VCTVPKLFFIEEIMEQKEVADMVDVDRGEDSGHFFWMKNQKFLLMQSQELITQKL
jgi:hypothetical protein